jgi:hypothetical protein
MNIGEGTALGTLKIDRRFNGPPESGNGGYVCGEIAKAWNVAQAGDLESGVRVRLQQPPALETRLEITATEDGCGLFRGETLIARAWPESLELEVPEAVDFSVATQAARAFRGHEEHAFPSCFVCGPERSEGDGLRIFTGSLPPNGSSMDGVSAAPWRPDASLGGGLSGDDPKIVDPAFVWAALDCPGAFSFPQPEGAVILLGEMCAALPGAVKVDEPCTLLAWKITESGRKHTTGTALYDSTGACLSLARAMWIEIPDDGKTNA